MTAPSLQEILSATGSALGVATGFCALFPSGRVWLGKAFMFIVTPVTAPWSVRRLEKRLMAVEYETKPNSGGSMKDVVGKTAVAVEKIGQHFETFVTRSEARYRNDFQSQRGPAFELDASGRATLVSFALGRLCRVDDASLELTGRAWLQFLDADEREEFIRTFRESASDGSMFRTQIRWFSRTNEDRGMWAVRAVPLDVSRLYSASMIPVDDIAKGVAARNGWPT